MKKKFKFTINSNKYNVDIIEVEGANVKLEVNGTPYEVEVDIEQKKPSKTPNIIHARKPLEVPVQNINSKKGTPINAPLPGTIISVNVSIGSVVKQGDKLLIMEAMKMENNILAEQDGEITKINVKAGDIVLQGDILIEIA